MKQIFIGGTGRSGTTILKKIISSHSNVMALPGELRVLTDPGGALELVTALSDRWSPYNADMAIQRFRTMVLESSRGQSELAVTAEKVEKRAFRYLGVSSRRYLGLGFGTYFGKRHLRQSLEELVSELSHQTVGGSWFGSPPLRIGAKMYEADVTERSEVVTAVADFFSRLYANMEGAESATHWLDDTPMNLLHAHELLALYPEMKLLHIYRDPRDVVASYKTFAWGGDDYGTTARRVANIYRRWLDIREQLPPECYREVGLEALSEDAVEGLAAICDFLGLPEEDLLTNHSLNRVNSGRWQREIPVEGHDVIHHYLDEFIEEYGYC